MKYVLIVALAVLLLGSASARAQPASPQPTEYGTGSAYNTSFGYFPGDPHGALGLNFLVLKANDEFIFINRSGLSSGNNQPPAPLSDVNFWGLTIPSTSVLVPGGNPPPSGLVTVSPCCDGRVFYDPYSPCGDGVGRWLVVELANFVYSDNTTGSGVLVGVSNGEDPNPADSGVSWTIFAIASSGSSADFPGLGFNTNWLAITALKFFPDSNGVYDEPLLFVTERQPLECSGTLPANPAVMAMSGNGAGLCTGSSASGTPTAWYCNDSNLGVACPAETYHTYGQDLDGSNLYLIKSLGGSGGSVDLFEVNGSPSSPTYEGVVAPPSITSQLYPGNGKGGWNPALLDPMPQGGTGAPPIGAGPNDDRFTSCVVRNYGIWAAQTVGLPTSGSAQTNVVQWWNIGVDDVLGTIYAFDRIGGTGSNLPQGLPSYDTLKANAIDASIAVNAESDFIVGFSEVPTSGTLSSGYVFKHHSGCSEYAPNIYYTGAGVYEGPSGQQLRTGDYSHSNPDPTDDMTLFTTEGLAGGGQLASGGYGWQASWALVPLPTQAVEPTFVGYQDVETECTATPCSVTFKAPTGAKTGDWFFVNLVVGLETSLTSVPSGWTATPLENRCQFGICPTVMKSSDSCGEYFGGWLYAHKYTSGETASYTFTAPAQTVKLCNGQYVGTEVGGFLTSYRNACQFLYAPPGLAEYHADGYPQTSDNYSISVGPISPPGDNMTLENVFFGSNEKDDNNNCMNFSSSGLAGLTTETPLSSCLDILPFVDADLWPVDGGSYGPYSTSDNFKGPKMGWQLLMPPY